MLCVTGRKGKEKISHPKLVPQTIGNSRQEPHSLISVRFFF